MSRNGHPNENEFHRHISWFERVILAQGSC